MSSNKDFLPSSSPIPSICAIEIEAILFLFMMNCYKSSFQECITIIVLKIERTGNQPPYCLLQLQDGIPPPLVGLSGDSPHPPPESVRTDGRTDADVRTKIFRINGLPNLLTHGAPRAPLKINSAITWKNFSPASWDPGIVMKIYHVIAIAGPARLAGPTLSCH